MNVEELIERRNYIYHRTPQRKLHSEKDALAFINEVGFCFLFTSQGTEMPTLYEAIVGNPDSWTTSHDFETGRTWTWKDNLPVAKKCFYGKLLRDKPVLVSLDLFPYFYAISENYGDLDQYLEEYQDGKLGLAAKQIHEALLYHGAMPTSELRRRANLAGHDNARAFERGLVELQMRLKITKTGISEANRWHYCYVYDLLPRWLPEQVEEGLAIKSRDAYPVIVRRYLRNVIVSTVPLMVRLFGWPIETIEHAVAALAASGEIRTDVQVEGLGGTWIGVP
jgi:hypothetical protein